MTRSPIHTQGFDITILSAIHLVVLLMPFLYSPKYIFIPCGILSHSKNLNARINEGRYLYLEELVLIFPLFSLFTVLVVMSLQQHFRLFPYKSLQIDRRCNDSCGNNQLLNSSLKTLEYEFRIKMSAKVLLGNELLVWMALYYTDNKHWLEKYGLSIEYIKILHLDIFSDSELLPCNCSLYYLCYIGTFLKWWN